MTELLSFAMFLVIIAKAALYTGIGPAIFIVSVAEMWVNAERVPARKPCRRWQVWVNPNPPSAGKRVA